MPPRPPAGMRYTAREPAGEYRPVDRPSLTLAPESLVAPEAVPQASGTTLPALPAAFYPGAGPTALGYLYSALQNAVFPGSANTYTVPQVFSNTGTSGVAAPVQSLITDTGGGSDRDDLRPGLYRMEHDTTLATVAGVGCGIESWVKDASGNLVRIGRDIAEITTTTAGVVDSTRTFCVQKGGLEIESLRIRGATGQAAYTPAGGTTGLSGQAGGEVLVWGSLYHFGSLLGFFGTTPITKPAVSGSRAGNAALASLLTQLAALGLLTDGSS